ncbi:MAG: hypothetical protein ABSB83_01990 [Methanomassiliicoccales archaeon]
MRLFDLDDPKKKAFFMRFFWAVSTFMLLFGFLIMLLYWNA